MKYFPPCVDDRRSSVKAFFVFFFEYTFLANCADREYAWNDVHSRSVVPTASVSENTMFRGEDSQKHFSENPLIAGNRLSKIERSQISYYLCASPLFTEFFSQCGQRVTSLNTVRHGVFRSTIVYFNGG